MKQNETLVQLNNKNNFSFTEIRFPSSELNNQIYFLKKTESANLVKGGSVRSSEAIRKRIMKKIFCFLLENFRNYFCHFQVSYLLFYPPSLYFVTVLNK
jgi:hypothetical protein